MSGKSIFRKYHNLINLIARFSDPVAVILAAYLAYCFVLSNENMGVPLAYYQLLVGFAFLLVVIVFPIFNLYLSWRGLGMLRQIKTVILAWSTVIVLIILSLFIFKISAEFSRLWLGVWAVLGLFLILFMRFIVFTYLKIQRSKGRNLRHVVVIGAGHLAKRVATQLKESAWTGYKIAAFFDDDTSLTGQFLEGVEIKGTLDVVNDFMNKKGIDEVWIALPLRSEMRMKELFNSIRDHTVTIKLLPDIFGFSLLYHSLTEVAGLPAVNLSDTPMGGGNILIKAVEDKIIASIILVLISPLMLVISLLIKFTSEGPVFYKQKRISWNGKSFDMLKFRSMPVDVEKEAIVWGNAGDKKTTWFGNFLRKTSLDELPQFINVLKGDMSIVGPRPERTEFVQKFKDEIPGYMQKHMVKAGITGWAQVNGWRGDTCVKTRVEYDLYYIENWSLWFDLKIIILTFLKGFVHPNAY